MAKHFNCKFIETSAKQRINVDEAFSNLVREIRKYNRVRLFRFKGPGIQPDCKYRNNKLVDHLVRMSVDRRGTTSSRKVATAMAEGAALVASLPDSSTSWSGSHTQYFAGVIFGWLFRFSTIFPQFCKFLFRLVLTVRICISTTLPSCQLYLPYRRIQIVKSDALVSKSLQLIFKTRCAPIFRHPKALLYAKHRKSS